MNVWIRKTRKQSACKHCDKMILTGEYQVVCQYYMKLSGSRTWWKRMSFHPQCWIDRAIAEIEKRPVVETRGWGSRKRIPDCDRDARFAILRRRASVIQRIKREVEEPRNGQDTDKIIHLGELLNRLKEEIEPLGGAPESWT